MAGGSESERTASAARGGSSAPSVDQMSDAGKRAFFRIAERWGLSVNQALTLLGAPSKSLYFLWKKGQGGRLPHDTLERISYLLGIYKGLQILFASPDRADAWVKKPNEAFGGQSALRRMLAGNVSDLQAVRQYIDHVRGGRS